MQNLKQLSRKISPDVYQSLRQRFGTPARFRLVGKKVIAKYGKNVVEGPFKGMKYLDQATGSAFPPKILGCYELEIHPFIEEIIHHQYSTIIDVGCAEGYYAVGFAFRCPETMVYAFDIDPKSQVLCNEMAALNNVSPRVIVGGSCDPRSLQALPLDKALIFCDIEGYEMELLDPSQIPELQYIDILVELHEPMRPGVTKDIVDRFSGTHQIKIVDSVARNSAQHPLVNFLSEEDQKIALNEGRPPGQQFAFLKSRSAKA